MILFTSTCIEAHRWGFYTEKTLPGGKSVHTFPFLREADGANPQSGRLITQETSSPPSSARDAAGIGGAREGMPRQSRIFRIASGGLIAARILMRPASVGGTPGHQARKRGAKAQPTNNSVGGMEHVAGRNIPLLGGDQPFPPILCDGRDARGNPAARSMVRRTAST